MAFSLVLSLDTQFVKYAFLHRTHSAREKERIRRDQKEGNRCILARAKDVMYFAIYRVIQEKRQIFWDVIISVIVRKNLI